MRTGNLKQIQRKMDKKRKYSHMHTQQKRLINAPPQSYNGFKASDSAPQCFLSNLFGGAEFHMASRFEHNGSHRVATLLRTLADIDFDHDKELFQEYRLRLQGKQSNAYFKENKVAAGVLATLINGCFRKSMEKRLQVVNQIADELGIDGEPLTRQDFFIQDDEQLADQKKEWMQSAHDIKFAQPFYRDVLKHAHPDWLFERKNGRMDANSNWAGRDGWMAEVLQHTYSKIQE